MRPLISFIFCLGWASFLSQIAEASPPETAQAHPIAPPNISASDTWNSEKVDDARVTKMKPHTQGIRVIVIHHSETPVTSDEPGRLRSIWRYHTGDKGWGDIAYHYLIGSDGKIYAGRPEKFQGDSATRYDLDGKLLICLMGSFKSRLPTEAALSSLTWLVKHKRAEYQLAPAAIATHRELAATDCPGDRLQQWVDQRRKGDF